MKRLTKSEFKPGCYDGYAAGEVWRIKKVGGFWRATANSRLGHTALLEYSTLRALDAKLEAMAKDYIGETNK